MAEMVLILYRSLNTDSIFLAHCYHVPSSPSAGLLSGRCLQENILWLHVFIHFQNLQPIVRLYVPLSLLSPHLGCSGTSAGRGTCSVGTPISLTLGALLPTLRNYCYKTLEDHRGLTCAVPGQEWPATAVSPLLFGFPAGTYLDSFPSGFICSEVSFLLRQGELWVLLASHLPQEILDAWKHHYLAPPKSEHTASRPCWLLVSWRQAIFSL